MFLTRIVQSQVLATLLRSAQCTELLSLITSPQPPVHRDPGPSPRACPLSSSDSASDPVPRSGQPTKTTPPCTWTANCFAASVNTDGKVLQWGATFSANRLSKEQRCLTSPQRYSPIPLQRRPSLLFPGQFPTLSFYSRQSSIFIGTTNTTCFISTRCGNEK